MKINNVILIICLELMSTTCVEANTICLLDRPIVEKNKSSFIQQQIATATPDSIISTSATNTLSTPQAHNTTSTPIPEDNIRRFDEAALKEFKNSDTYLYDRPPPNPSPFQQFWQWLLRTLGNLFPDGTASNFYYYAKYLLMALGIVFVITRLFKIDLSSLFYQKPKQNSKISLPFDVFEENIHQIDFPNLIEQAVKQGLYRNAIRLHYLQVLKRLSDLSLIKWELNKTNRDYVLELSKNANKVQFRELTKLFNYVWYGNFEVGKADFQQMQQRFQDFTKDLR